MCEICDIIRIVSIDYKANSSGNKSRRVEEELLAADQELNGIISETKKMLKSFPFNDVAACQGILAFITSMNVHNGIQSALRNHLIMGFAVARLATLELDREKGK